ncbi:MAG: class I SAM-dependent methyltransferase [Desulfuromonadaceae bacterium]|nr:class I SAM-dependent methyltransferase [Desulfuromonadaceae bacterium]MDD5107511.1 class I SAM-dependent methyltransferase [Desulfuromonadaceae bacterium]
MKIINWINKIRGKKTLELNRSSGELNRICGEFEVDNWAVSRFVMDRLLPVVGIHPFPLNEQMLMVAAVCRLQPTHIFEWGTNIGKSARLFYETCTALGMATEIHSIDLPDDIEHAEHPHAKRGYLVRGMAQVKLHLGDGLDTSLEILRNSPEMKARPLFFVDGDHGYTSVQRELAGIVEHVPQAHILLHDTFYQSDESGYNTGPYRAIAELLRDCDQYRVVSQNIGLPGMTLLWQSQ